MSSPVLKKRKSNGVNDGGSTLGKTERKGKRKSGSGELAKELDLIDGRVSKKQISKAVNALLAHVRSKMNEESKTSSNLLPEQQQAIWLQITTKRVGEERRLKPVEIPLAHPYHQEEGGVCLITKDPQREYKDKLEALGLFPGMISRVVGISKLKGKFKPFEARRQLVQDHSLFLADDRVVTLLPQLCGKVFFERKKIPVPLNLARSKDLKRDISRLCNATYLNLNTGSCSNLKVGTTNMSNNDVVENLVMAIQAVANKIPRQWDNIQVLHLKTNMSIALPLWNSDISQGMALDDEDKAKMERERIEMERIKRRKLKKAAAAAAAATAPAPRTAEPTALNTVEAALDKKRKHEKAVVQLPKDTATVVPDVFDAEDTEGLDLADKQPLKKGKSKKIKAV